MDAHRPNLNRRPRSPVLGVPMPPNLPAPAYRPMPRPRRSWWGRNWWIVLLSSLGVSLLLGMILAATQSEYTAPNPADAPSSYGSSASDNSYLDTPNEAPSHWPSDITYRELQAVPSITDDQIARGAAIALNAPQPMPPERIPVGLRVFLDVLMAAATDAGAQELTRFYDPAGVAACSYRRSRIREISHSDAKLAGIESWALAEYQVSHLAPGDRSKVVRYEVNGLREAFSVQTGLAPAYREVYVSIVYEDGSRDRHWLLMRQDAAAWQCCDHVNLDMGWRGSELSTRFLLDADQAEINRIHEQFETLVNAHRQTVDGNPEEAIHLAETVDPTQTILASYRHAALGRAYLGMGQMTLALHHLNLAQDLWPAYRYVSIYKAQACIGLGLYDRALKHLDDYEEALGYNDELWCFRGEVYQALGSPARAAGAYRRAMAHHSWAFPLLGLGQVVEADRADEVGQYYLKLNEPAESFFPLANAYMDSGAEHSLRALLDAHRTIKPDDQALPFYEAQTLRLQGDLAGARKLLQDTLPNITDTELHPVYEREVVLLHLADDQPLEGYRWASDKRDAFATLAAELVGLGDDERLGELIRAHKANHPDDPVLASYTGEWHLMRDEPAKALPYYQAAWRTPTDDPLQAQTRRVNLVYCLHILDRHDEAYRTVQPQADTFSQLAMLLNSEGDRDRLLKLSQKRVADAPNDGEALYWLGEALFQQEEIERAHDAFQAAYRHSTQDHAYRISIADKLIRCLVRMRHWDRARSLARTHREQHHDPYYELLVATRRDDQSATALRLARKLEKNGYLLHRLTEDPDLAVGLERPVMAPVRRLCEQSRPTPAASPTP